MLWRQSERDQGGGGCIHRDATPYPNHSLDLCNKVLNHPEESRRFDSGSWLSTDKLVAAQAGWWEHQQDAPGWEQGHSASRDTCRAMEIIAGNKPVSFLTLVKQLRGDTRHPTQTRRRRRPLPGRRGDGISVGAAGVARGARPRPSPRRAALLHPAPLLLLASRAHRQLPTALSSGQGW